MSTRRALGNHVTLSNSNAVMLSNRHNAKKEIGPREIGKNNNKKTTTKTIFGGAGGGTGVGVGVIQCNNLALG